MILTTKTSDSSIEPQPYPVIYAVADPIIRSLLDRNVSSEENPQKINLRGEHIKQEQDKNGKNKGMSANQPIISSLSPVSFLQLDYKSKTIKSCTCRSNKVELRLVFGKRV